MKNEMPALTDEQREEAIKTAKERLSRLQGILLTADEDFEMAPIKGVTSEIYLVQIALAALTAEHKAKESISRK